MIRTTLLCFSVSGVLGCSLVKLSGDIDQEQCETNADCEVLNDRKAPDFDACELWQCSQTTFYCEILPLDQDGDGAGPAMCEDDASKADCDDDDKARAPDNQERCDAIDNDCDSHVDEGVLEMKRNTVSTFTGAHRDGAEDVAYAVDSVSGVVAAAPALAGSPNRPGFGLIASTLTSGEPIAQMTSSVDLSADSLGVTPLGGDKFAVAFINKSGLPRLVAGVVNKVGASFNLIVDGPVGTDGLPCAAGENCASGTPSTSTPSLAALGRDVLVGYVRIGGATSSTCPLPAPMPVQLHRLLYATGTDVLSEPADQALLLGETSDPVSPALLGIPALGPADDPTEVGFLAAFADAAGDVVLLQLHEIEDEFASGATLLTLAKEGDGLSDISLTLGPEDDGSRIVGVAAKRGCSTAARIVVYLLRLSINAGGALRIERIAGPSQVGGSQSETGPSIAYSAEHESWAVAYRDPTGLRMRVLDTQATPLGSEAYRLLQAVTSGNDEVQILSSPLAVALQARKADWFGAVTYTKRAAEGDPYALEAVTLSSCQGR